MRPIDEYCASVVAVYLVFGHNFVGLAPPAPGEAFYEGYEIEYLTLAVSVFSALISAFGTIVNVVLSLRADRRAALNNES